MAQTPVRRGRRRRPRPRRIVFAVGGLALAAGALSLVRAGHEPGPGGAGRGGAETRQGAGQGAGRAEAEPRQDAGQGAGTDRSGNAVATVEAVPRVSPSATSVMGRTGTTPASGLVPLPGRPASPGAAPAVTTTATAPQEPNAPSPTTTPNPPPRPT